jgi:tape measure domain-containing protein
MTTTIGTIQLIATINTSQYKKAANDIDAANKKIEGSANSTEKNSNSAFSKIAKVGLAGVGAAAVAAGALIVKNIGNAVSRVDTLNNFPRVMANLGYGADEAKSSIDKLDKGVRGLPTSLDAIASAMQNIAPSTSSLDEATELTLAFNNALLAGGKSAEVQASALEQFSQAVAKGKPDMIEWRSIAAAMPGQLKQISENLGYKNWQEMAEAVSNGTLSFDEVKKSIVSLNKDGLGQFPSFADQAKNATGGLSTGIKQMNTAITRGIGDLIQSIGSENINKAVGNIGKSFEGFFNLLSRNIGVAATTVNVIRSLAPVLVTTAAVTLTYRGAVIATNTIMKLQATYAALTKTQYALLNGQLIAVRTATVAQTIAQGALNAVMAINPIVLATGAVALLAGGLYALTRNTDNTNNATSRLTEARKQAKTATDNLKTSEDALRGALLNQEGANLAVEQAQLRYNEAVARFGAKSLEARQANYDLKTAIDAKKKADEEAMVAQQNRDKSQEESNKKKEAVKVAEQQVKKEVDKTTKSIEGQYKVLGDLNTSLKDLSGKNFTYGVSGNINKPPGRAMGGSVSAGRSYLVGENRDGSINKTTELFTPNSSGRIINAKDLRSAIGKDAGGQSTVYNIKVDLSGIFAKSTADVRDMGKMFIRTVNQELAAKQQPLIGGGAI